MTQSAEMLVALQEVRETEPFPLPELTVEPEPLDVGDWVWVVYWRPWPMGGDKFNGSWESAQTRVVALARSGLVCHEVSNSGVAPDDASQPESFLRWTVPNRIFRTSDAAQEARRTLKNPNY